MGWPLATITPPRSLIICIVLMAWCWISSGIAPIVSVSAFVAGSKIAEWLSQVPNVYEVPSAYKDGIGTRSHAPFLLHSAPGLLLRPLVS